MEIIKHGNIKKCRLKTYTATCYKCGCVYKYNEDEIREDFREHDMWTQCPECKMLNDHRGFNIEYDRY